MQELDLTERFAAALGAVPADLRGGPVGLAVSGGSDSSALLHLARQWAHPAGAALTVFTVDHGLRTGSAEEARRVASVCRSLSLPHRTLRWTAPEARQIAARRARHALLAGALRQDGGRLLLTGHTADDQAETVLMRARQGSGWYGLAGMRPVSLSPVWPEGEGIWIARPLLGETRGALRSALRRAGHRWSDDPSNENAAFERVRVRGRLGGAGAGLTARVLACQRGAARLRAAEDGALARWLGEAVRLAPDGVLRAQFRGLSPGRAARGLGVLLQCTAGRETPPRTAQLEALAARLMSPEAFRGATLGGVRLRPGRAGIAFAPESGPLLDAAGNARLAARISAFQRLFSISAQENDAGSGKESFLQEMEPIFSD